MTVRRRAVAAALALVLAGCREGARTTPDGSSPRIVEASALGEDACLDAWLSARRLDPYGSPPGTVYPGGSPLLDETRGETERRSAYVYRRHPDAARACARPDEGGAGTAAAPPSSGPTR